MTLSKGMILLTDFHEFGISHEKFAVVLSEDSNGYVGLCLINSKPAMLPKKKNFQIELLSINYKEVLSHNSYVDCAEVKITKKELIDDYFNNRKAKVCGYLNEQDMQRVIDAGKSNINFALNKKEKDFF